MQKKQGIFICGKDVSLALDMMDSAKQSMVPPFEVSVFLILLDRLQLLTAMVACTEKTLKDNFNTTLKNKGEIVIYGGKGIVGGISAVMCSEAGAHCKIISYDGISNVQKADEYKKRFGVDVTPADGSNDN